MKPIITASFKGIFINQKPWEEAHHLWFNDKEKELKTKNLPTKDIEEWKMLNKNPKKEKIKYFSYVDKIMNLLYPTLNDREKTIKARETYFDSVIKFIKKNPKVVNKEAINIFSSLKKSYKLGIITTNTSESFSRILKASKIRKGLFDFVSTSNADEKDDKEKAFDRFVKNYGKPKYYITTSNDFEHYCKKKYIRLLVIDPSREISKIPTFLQPS